MAIPAHKTEYFIIENSNLQKKANTAWAGVICHILGNIPLENESYSPYSAYISS